MENEKYTCVEVIIPIEKEEDEEILDKIISDYLEEDGYAGGELSSGFDQVNFFGDVNKTNECLVTFLGEGHNFARVTRSVTRFLNAMLKEMNDKEAVEETGWLEELEIDEMPNIKEYKILRTRKYEE